MFADRRYKFPIVGGLLCLCASASWAQVASQQNTPPVEKLTKTKGQYLGWQTSREQFRTCNDNMIPIEDGKIEKTNEKCPKRGPLKLVFEQVEVYRIDPSGRVVEVKGREGAGKYYYPIAAETTAGNVALRNVKPGDSMLIGTAVPGRIDYMRPAERRHE